MGNKQILLVDDEKPVTDFLQEIMSRANLDSRVANSGAEAIDLLPPEATDPSVHADFKGNMDLEGLEDLIRQNGPGRIPLTMMTVTNNSNAGQPVSMQNIRETKKLLKKLKCFFCIFPLNPGDH